MDQTKTLRGRRRVDSTIDRLAQKRNTNRIRYFIGRFRFIFHYISYYLYRVFSSSSRKDEEFVKNSKKISQKILSRALVNEPLVSVIMPTWQRAYCIKHSIESVLNQRYQNIELLIIDDCSKDRTEKIVRRFKDDPRIFYYKNERQEGVSFARNVGLAKSTGDFIAYCDSDNTWRAEFLAVIIRYMMSKRAAIAYSIIKKYALNKISYLTTPFNWQSLVKKNFIDLNVFVHEREVFERLGGFNENLFRFVDWDLILRYTKTYGASYLPFVGCDYSDIPRAERITDSVPASFHVVRYGHDDELLKYNDLKARCLPEIPGRTSIIIPFVNNIGITIDCVDSILKHTQTDYEIILIDNGSDRKAAKRIVETYKTNKRIRIIRHRSNLGFALGNNIGFYHSSGEYVLFLNNDTLATKGWLSVLVDALEKSSGVGAVQPKLIYPDGTVQSAGMVFSRHSVIPYILYAGESSDAPHVNKPRKLNAVVGACMLIRADDFIRLNGFDIHYINGAEDIDLCLRLKKDLGKSVRYEPKSTVVHLESKSPGRNDAIQYNRLIFYRRWKNHGICDDETIYREDGFWMSDYQYDGWFEKDDRISSIKPSLKKQESKCSL